MPIAINLENKLNTFEGHWQPKIVTQFNNNDVMVAKIKGEFVWHTHHDTDDFFMVLKGQVTIQLKEGNVVLNPGEIYVVPKGVEHAPMTTEEAHILLIEPTGTANTGDAATAVVKLKI
jgi:mannose-6-phosphate isomerase-like protein (cupin superfamily)